jgi:hypothetical protein
VSNFKVGDRVRLQGAVGTITELSEDRPVARIKLDDGRPVTCDLRLLLAAHDEAAHSTQRTAHSGDEEPEPVVKDKMIRGPVARRKR